MHLCLPHRVMRYRIQFLLFLRFLSSFFFCMEKKYFRSKERRDNLHYVTLKFVIFFHLFEEIIMHFFLHICWAAFAKFQSKNHTKNRIQRQTIFPRHSIDFLLSLNNYLIVRSSNILFPWRTHRPPSSKKKIQQLN